MSVRLTIFLGKWPWLGSFLGCTSGPEHGLSLAQQDLWEYQWQSPRDLSEQYLPGEYQVISGLVGPKGWDRPGALQGNLQLSF
jgi:hypothetical protein